MIRYISAILLLCAFAIQSFNGFFIVINYYSNTASFAKNCENKYKPQLNCEGKCVMMKKMIAAEKKEQQAPQRKLEIKNDVYTPESFTAQLAFNNTSSIRNNFIRYSNSPLSGYQHSVFHPPAFA